VAASVNVGIIILGTSIQTGLLISAPEWKVAIRTGELTSIETNRVDTATPSISTLRHTLASCFSPIVASTTDWLTVSNFIHDGLGGTIRAIASTVLENWVIDVIFSCTYRNTDTTSTFIFASHPAIWAAVHTFSLSSSMNPEALGGTTRPRTLLPCIFSDNLPICSTFRNTFVKFCRPDRCAARTLKLA